MRKLTDQEINKKAVSYKSKYHPFTASEAKDVAFHFAKGLLAARTYYEGGEDIHADGIAADLLRRVVSGKVEYEGGPIISWDLHDEIEEFLKSVPQEKSPSPRLKEEKTGEEYEYDCICLNHYGDNIDCPFCYPPPDNTDKGEDDTDSRENEVTALDYHGRHYKELLEKRGQVAQLVADNTSLRKQLVDMDGKLAGKEFEIEQLKNFPVFTIAAELDSQVKSLTSQLEEATEMIQRVIVERETVETQLEEANSKVKGLSDLNNEVIMRNANMENELHEAREYWQIADRESYELKKLNAEKDKEIERLKEDLAIALKAQIKGIASELSLLRDKSLADKKTALEPDKGKKGEK